MRKFLLISVIIASAVMDAAADEPVRDFPRFTFGLEGNCILSAISYSHINYIAADGYRVDRRGSDCRPAVNGELLLNAGYNIGRHMNMALCFGISGISRGETVMPLSLRLTVLFGRDPLKARWFSFIDGGTGIGTGTVARFSPVAKIGAGYRISLTKSAKLDFMLSLRSIYTHPQITEFSEGDMVQVPSDRIRRSQAFYNAVMLGVGLNF